MNQEISQLISFGRLAQHVVKVHYNAWHIIAFSIKIDYNLWGEKWPQDMIFSVKSHSNFILMGFSNIFGSMKSLNLYMVQYAEIQHFYKKFGKNENFYLPVIFKVIRVMSSYISQTVHRTIKAVTSISSIPADF